jgi:hypothetical protein
VCSTREYFEIGYRVLTPLIPQQAARRERREKKKKENAEKIGDEGK